MTYVLGEINCTFPATPTIDGVNPSTETLACQTPSYDTMNLFAYGETGGGAIGNPPVVTINAMPYARTVAMDSITISGTATESPTSITWSASPSGLSGSFTPGASWSGSVSIPNGGVETITVTATNAFGSDTDTVTVGFYVGGAHTFLNAQNIDGSYNSTLVNNDPVTTWRNLGSSALDVTQSTATAKPTYRTNFVNGQPVVKGDGGDYMVAALASDWRFLHEDTRNHVYGAAKLISGTTQIGVYGTSQVSSTNEGVVFYTTISNDRISRLIRNNTPTNIILQTPTAVAWPEGTQWYDFDNLHDGTLGSLEGKIYINNVLINEASASGSYSSGTGPFAPLTIMSSANANRIGAQEWFSFLIYNGSVLDNSQRAVNHSVTEWALGGTLPLTA